MFSWIEPTAEANKLIDPSVFKIISLKDFEPKTWANLERLLEVRGRDAADLDQGVLDNPVPVDLEV